MSSDIDKINATFKLNFNCTITRFSKFEPTMFYIIEAHDEDSMAALQKI